MAADAHLPYSRKAVCSSANCILQARNCKRRSLPYPDEKVEDACMDGADEQAQAYKPADPYADRVMIWYPEDTDGLPDDLRAALETGLCLTSAQRNRFFALADARARAPGPAEPPQRLLLTDDASDGDEAGADDAGADVCPVCLEALWRRPVAFFADAGRGRACPHFLHATCAAQIARHSDRCPTCRAPFARPRAMPPLDYADLAWVSTLCDGDGGVRRRDACASTPLLSVAVGITRGMALSPSVRGATPRQRARLALRWRLSSERTRLRALEARMRLCAWID